MNSPYMGKFRVSQTYSSSHTGLDLVGVDSKEIHATVAGKVIRAGWENDNDHSQGWGLRVVIQKSGTNQYYYYGHLSELKCSVGDTVKVTDIIGIEGNTGCSTGSHCHYECRLNDSKSEHQNISTISGIPNALGTYDDGYAAGTTSQTNKKSVTLIIDGVTYSGELSAK